MKICFEDKFRQDIYLHGTQNPEIIFDFLLNLIHVTTAKSHITFTQVCSRASQIIFVLKHNPFTDVISLQKTRALPGMKE